MEKSPSKALVSDGATSVDLARIKFRVVLATSDVDLGLLTQIQ